MSDGRPYHHGNLRQALVDQALVVLRTAGVEALSLRELAREVGVSHGAPQRHFRDRQALLEALAVEGFGLLGARLRRVATGSEDFGDRVRGVAAEYVAFAAAEAELLELMFAHQERHEPDVVGESAHAAFVWLLDLFGEGEAEGAVAPGAAAPTATIFLAMLQGLTALANCGVVPVGDLGGLTDDAVRRLLAPVGPGAAPARRGSTPT